MNDSNETVGRSADERRQRLDLRDIFDDVKARVEPFCQTGGASLEYWAAQAVREAYPTLDEQGLQIVVRAALRVCRVGNQARTV
ncbi:MAG: hypothetical protein H6935_08570 [Thiobacillus sp.]|nr:hypothetical protein [Thiobacillus sp.]